MKFFENGETQIFALGGLGEVGKNMYVIMHNSELIIIDSGMMLPKDELLGIDYVIQDYTFLVLFFLQHMNNKGSLLLI